MPKQPPKYKMQERDKRCHDLYVKWALKHLLILTECLHKLYETCNMNMLDSQIALFNEREKLIKTNPAYAEAWTLLQEMKEYIPLLQDETIS